MSIKEHLWEWRRYSNWSSVEKDDAHLAQQKEVVPRGMARGVKRRVSSFMSKR